jgi:hypothetical protein
VELFEVAFAELLETLSTNASETHAHGTMIVLVGAPIHESDSFGPINERDSTVVAQQESIGDVADRWSPRILVGAYREEESVLRGCKPDGCRGLLPPLHEALQSESGLE